jgi:predicted nucleic acid-binding protein
LLLGPHRRQKTVSFAQVGQIYFGGVGQFCIGVDSWSIKPRMTTDIVTHALTMAWLRRKPGAGVIFHSDRGSQYASQAMTGRDIAHRIALGGTISVQVLNEFAAVALRKLRMPWSEIHDVLAQIRAVCAVAPVTIETHERALHVADRYGLSIYDALIVSAALLSGCKTLHSEDLQDGQVIERQLTVRNPFQAP